MSPPKQPALSGRSPLVQIQHGPGTSTGCDSDDPLEGWSVFTGRRWLERRQDAENFHGLSFVTAEARSSNRVQLPPPRRTRLNREVEAWRLRR
jgi:hypothetical protein